MAGNTDFSVSNMADNSAKYCTCEELCFWQVTVASNKSLTY